MNRRSLLAGATALVGAPALIRPAAAQARTEVQFWYGLGGQLGEVVESVIKAFNDSQDRYRVIGTFKGSYPETMQAAIASWRAGNAPHIVQMFEVGTGTMLGAGPAVKQVWQLFEETGVSVDTSQYLAGVRGYYSLPDGRLASMPFNSSTAIMWYNKDAFAKAGLDPDAPPKTWDEVIAAARKLKAANATAVPVTTSWPTWIQYEQYSAIHDLPFSTKANGFAGLDTELKINSPAHVKHTTRLMEMAKEGLFRYAGRDNAPDPLFPSGEAAIAFASAGLRGRVAQEAKFAWADAVLPYDPEIKADPINGVIGGASLWVMTAPSRKPEEYKAVAEFFRFLSQPEVDASWHQRTGYVPITQGGYELSRKQGYYEKNPGADVPIIQLTRGTMTDNSRGFRLGRFVEIRNIIQEELEKGLQGQQTAQQAMDNAVTRGNRVLREFERAQRT